MKAAWTGRNKKIVDNFMSQFRENSESQDGAVKPVMGQKDARDLCSKLGLQQCVILAFSEERGYEIAAAGDNEPDAQTATEVALALKDSLAATGLPVRLAV